MSTQWPLTSDVATRGLETDPSAIPLCVDLDGTLLKTDLLYESLLLLIRQSALFAFHCVAWLLKGKAYLKHQIAARVSIDPERLSYHQPLLEFLKAEHNSGRRLVLCTATHEKYARQIATHVQLFDDVIATAGPINMGGKNKRLALVTRYGQRGFDYAGNSRADLQVWPSARKCILVNPAPAVERVMRHTGRTEHVFKDTPPSWRDYCRLFRLHQWAKNALLFAPVAAAQRLDEPVLIADALVAFVAFSFCASSVYIVNDLLDLDVDRKHPRKRYRPLAKGDISIPIAAMFVPVLLLASFGAALALPYEFLGTLGAYFLATLAYTVWLKRKLLVDVLFLAGLYTLRIIAGSAAVSIWPSFWLLAFSMFLFLSLALVKRYTELLSVTGAERGFLRGRSYQWADLASLNGLGTSSGYLSVLVLALYINRDNVSRYYEDPQWLWGLCLLLLYWLGRVWIVSGRGLMHDDPVVFALRDRVSRWLIVSAAIVVWLAS